jgi:type IV secretory pathway VirB2 component (pilin)
MTKLLNRLATSAAVKVLTIDKDVAAKMIALTVCTLAVSVLFYDPALAQTLESIDKAATKFDTFIGGTFAKTVAGIALAGTGFAALFNRLSWFWFGAVMLGTAIIFGRKQIIDIFAGT